MDRRHALVVASVVVAAAVAAAPAQAITSTDKKQNKQLKELAEGLEDVVADITGLDSGLDDVVADVAALDSGLDDVVADVAGLDSGLDAAVASVSELEGLFSGYVNSPEYGVAQLYFDPEGDGFEANDALPGQILTTGDIPDDTNQATVTAKFLLTVPDGTTAKPVALKAAIRSGENDGTGAADPVGEAGLMTMTAEIIGGPGATVGGGNPGAPSTLPLTTKANPSLSGLPLYPIATKAPRTAVTPIDFPDGSSIELTDPATMHTITGAPGRFTMSNSSGAPAAGIVDVTVRFTDLEEDGLDLED